MTTSPENPPTPAPLPAPEPPPPPKPRLSLEAAKRIRMFALLAVVGLAAGIFLFLRGYGCGIKTYALAGQPVQFDYPANYTVEFEAGPGDTATAASTGTPTPGAPKPGALIGTWTASGGGPIAGFMVAEYTKAWKTWTAAQRQQDLDATLDAMAKSIGGTVVEHHPVQRPGGAREQYALQAPKKDGTWYLRIEFVPADDKLFTLMIEGGDPAVATDEHGVQFFNSVVVH